METQGRRRHVTVPAPRPAGIDHDGLPKRGGEPRGDDARPRIPAAPRYWSRCAASLGPYKDFELLFERYLQSRVRELRMKGF